MRAAAVSDMDYASAVLRLFREEPFYYTLTPPALGDESIDEFMFTSREDSVVTTRAASST